MYGLQKPTNEVEFVTGMKEFVSKPDAQDRVHGIADIMFQISTIQYIFTKSDLNGDGVIPRSEFRETGVKLLLSDEDDL